MSFDQILFMFRKQRSLPRPEMTQILMIAREKNTLEKRKLLAYPKMISKGYVSILANVEINKDIVQS